MMSACRRDQEEDKDTEPVLRRNRPVEPGGGAGRRLVNPDMAHFPVTMRSTSSRTVGTKPFE